MACPYCGKDGCTNEAIHKAVTNTFIRDHGEQAFGKLTAGEFAELCHKFGGYEESVEEWERAATEAENKPHIGEAKLIVRNRAKARAPPASE